MRSSVPTPCRMRSRFTLPPNLFGGCSSLHHLSHHSSFRSLVALSPPFLAPSDTFFASLLLVVDGHSLRSFFLALETSTSSFESARSHRSRSLWMLTTSPCVAPSSWLTIRAIWLTLWPMCQISERMRRSSSASGESRRSCSFRDRKCASSTASMTTREIVAPLSCASETIRFFSSSFTRM